MSPPPVDAAPRGEGVPSWAPSWFPSADRPRSVSGLRWVIVLLLGASLVSCVVQGADGPADPFLSPGPPVPGASRTPLPGFGETRITVSRPGGGLSAWCLLLAESDAQRQRGLMEVTDPGLGGYDGMLFRYEEDTIGPFYMRNTPMPLSIAFVDAGGALVSATDMVPCEDIDACPNYAASNLYRTAIEVPQGGLSRLGIVPGAVVTDDRAPC